MPKITIDITQPQLDFLNDLDYQGEIHPINYALSSAILSLQKKCTSDEAIGDLAWLNTTSLKEQQIKQDLEYLDKVALEAMKEVLKTFSDTNHGEHQKTVFNGVSVYCYNLAKAMLTQSKLVGQELLQEK